MHAQSLVLWQNRGLLNYQFRVLLAAMVIPEWLDLVQAGLFKPNMLPLLQLELVIGEVMLHSVDKIGENGVLPLEFMEVFAQSLREVLLSNDEH